MKKLFIILFSLLLLGATGCSNATPAMSSMQLRQMTTKEISGNYKTVFKAVMTALQDQNYIITNTDFDSGLISCEKEVEREGDTSEVLMVLFVDSRYDAGNSKLSVSATVDELTKNTSRVRLNIQEKIITHSSFGNNEKSNFVKDPEIYKSLFNDIAVETERLKAIK